MHGWHRAPRRNVQQSGSWSSLGPYMGDAEITFLSFFHEVKATYACRCSWRLGCRSCTRLTPAHVAKQPCLERAPLPVNGCWGMVRNSDLVSVRHSGNGTRHQALTSRQTPPTCSVARCLSTPHPHCCLILTRSG